MAGVAELANLLRDGASALRGEAGADAKARLARSALAMFAPELAPVVDGAQRLASHMGVRLTAEGLDLTGLRDLVAGRPIGEAVEAGDEPWRPFLSKLRGLRSGAVLILGPRGAGKTQLAVRLAEVWRREHGYHAFGINLYPGDRRPWITWRGVGIFLDAMENLVESLGQGVEPPDDIRRRILIIDEAALSLHPQGGRKAALAVSQAIREARHVQWLVVVVAHLTKDLPVQMTWCDAIFVKEPSGEEEFADREDSARLWQAAAMAYRERRRQGLLGKPIQGWVYTHAPDLGYKGMMPYGMAGEEDPHPGGPVRRIETPEGE